MTTKTINALVELCRQNQCSVTLEVGQTGIVATVRGQRGKVHCETVEWLDAQDASAGNTFIAAVKRIPVTITT